MRERLFWRRLETLSSCVRKDTYQAYLRLIQNFRKYQIQETKTKWSSGTIRQRKQYLSPLAWGSREPKNAYKKLKLNFKVKKCLIFAFLTIPAFIKNKFFNKSVSEFIGMLKVFRWTFFSWFSTYFGKCQLASFWDSIFATTFLSLFL